MSSKIFILYISIISVSFFSCNEVTKEYYENGVLKFEGKFDSDSNEVGVHKWYFPSSVLKQIINYTDNRKGKIISTIYYSTGNIKGESFYDKYVDIADSSAYYIKYYDSDTKPILFECRYKKNKRTGLAKWYYIDGRTKLIANYNNGNLNGQYKSYFSNGQLKLDALYEKDTVVYYTEYDSLGKWIDEYRYIEVNYKDSVIIGENFTIEFEVKGPKITLSDSVVCFFSISKFLENDVKEIDDQSGTIQRNKFSLSFNIKEEGEMTCSGIILTNRLNEKRKQHDMKEFTIYVVEKEDRLVNK